MIREMPPVVTNPSQLPPRFQIFLLRVVFHNFSYFKIVFFYYCSTPSACIAHPPERWKSTSMLISSGFGPTVSKIESSLPSTGLEFFVRKRAGQAPLEKAKSPTTRVFGLS
jgi:hypothetical protein